MATAAAERAPRLMPSVLAAPCSGLPEGEDEGELGEVGVVGVVLLPPE